ncbi:TetR family transcriptional regulator [Glycomyces harbinensis]|uniref:Transcriptional regulator, TetR family n=1 Tax=Glycomyces harbinensis TaxID=58114 RepID=A0A1G6WYY7_9ACTN|nr:TetR family transcriptional regulator [Glycomyces harbinensis]SDD70215.1 transcriptional regulator, TetR family [Glycomyces harbinensis]
MPQVPPPPAPRAAPLSAAELAAADLPGAESYAEVPRRLLLSAVRAFAANGFHGTTTRDIASGANLSPAALYVHFPSKELALFAIVSLGHRRARDILTAAAPTSDPTARLRELVSRYTQFHARHHVVARVCQYELGALDEEHYAEVLAVRHETNEVFRLAVAAGVDAGRFDPDLDVHRTTRALISLAIDLARWYRPDGPDSPEELGRFNADLAERLVAPSRR